MKCKTQTSEGERKRSSVEKCSIRVFPIRTCRASHESHSLVDLYSLRKKTKKNHCRDWNLLLFLKIRISRFYRHHQQVHRRQKKKTKNESKQILTYRRRGWRGGRECYSHRIVINDEHGKWIVRGITCEMRCRECNWTINFGFGGHWLALPGVMFEIGD